MSSECVGGFVQMPNESIIYDALEGFHSWYGKGHYILCSSICTVGVLMNLLIIIVLARRDMRTAVNAMLTFIAVCDTVVMLSYLVFMVHFDIIAHNRCEPADFTYAWAAFALLHQNVALVGHTSSLWISVAMAQIRHTTLTWAEKGANRMISVTQAVFVSVIIILLICVAETPVFLSYSIGNWPLKYNIVDESTCPESKKDQDTYMIRVDPKTNCLLLNLSFWTNGLVFKLIPCFLLTIFIALLLRFLRTLQRRRMQLRTPSTLDSPQNNAKDKTTYMLVVLLAIFLATEVPQGILSFLSGIFTEKFRLNVYNRIGNVLDLLSLVNSASNFVILTTMSKQFRTTFLQMFMSKTLYKSIVGTEENKPAELTVVRNRIVKEERGEQSRLV